MYVSQGQMTHYNEANRKCPSTSFARALAREINRVTTGVPPFASRAGRRLLPESGNFLRNHDTIQSLHV